MLFFFFFQAEDGIRDLYVTGVQTCALPILNVTRLCRQRVHESVGCNCPGGVKDSRASKRLGWQKVRVIEDIKDLRPELDVEILRNAMDGEVLSRGEIHIDKFRANERVAASIAQEIRAINLAAGRRSRGAGKSTALSGKRR